MSGRKKTNQKSGRRGRASPSPIPPMQQKRFKAKNSSSQPWTNNSSQSSTFQSAASTAAGVAVGSIIGQAIGSTLAGNINHVSSAKAESKNSEEPCIPEIREFFECASRNEDLDTCKAYHDMWMKCQNGYKHKN
ncbi:coiled-coil-helix-coiled-coil-helix domain-containing protein 2-like [Apis cerana]|uniref:coiled-coil-helix-coiled-coil-helix domain-containing protein 2-like n=1 Tax=Apis cerana TaxID=7461 RepID=UPI0007E2C917|nr:coiled-coil-helix-coiled-coil-helix domain-containing protein 2-like [Apis cerana]